LEYVFSQNYQSERKMNVFKIKVGIGWDDDSFTIYTQLSEKQVRSVIEPMVEEQNMRECDYSDEDYIQAIVDRYPKHQTFSHLSEPIILEF
jgi:hypothetical protein